MEDSEFPKIYSFHRSESSGDKKAVRLDSATVLILEKDIFMLKESSTSNRTVYSSITIQGKYTKKEDVIILHAEKKFWGYTTEDNKQHINEEDVSGTAFLKISTSPFFTSGSDGRGMTSRTLVGFEALRSVDNMRISSVPFHAIIARCFGS